jgi:hypothetical protein
MSLLAACDGNAQTMSTASPQEAVALSAASIAATYRAVNVDAIDAYLAGSLLDPSQSIGALQRCLKTDNGVGTRPSPLANPQLAESSIDQRARLVETLAAYDVALASFVGAAPRIESQMATGDLQRAVYQLNVAANAHAPNDLFIEDLASELTPIAGQLAGARSAHDARTVALAISPTIAKFLNILSIDLAQWRAKALGASRLDVSRWLVVYQTTRRASEPKATQSDFTPIPIPRCYEPAFPSGDTSPIVDDTATDGAMFPGRDAILARLRAATDRDKALRAADTATVVSSLSALNDGLIKALQSPADAAAATDAHNALLHFSNAAHALSTASLPLVRTSF